MLARVQLRPNADADAVALVFAANALAATNPDERTHLEAAIVTAVRFQDAFGSWRSSRIAGAGDDMGWMFSTHEIAFAIVETLLMMARGDRLGARPLPSVGLEAAWSALSYAEQSRHHGDGDRPAGWAVEERYGLQEADWFATAMAAALAASLAELDDEVQRQTALARLPTEDPESEYWPSWQRWSSYLTQNEPIADKPILPELDARIVRQIHSNESKQNWPWARRPCVTTILYGPPGTTKTTIVKAVAQGVGWPLVTLGPGDFIRDGLERVEGRATEIFSDLMALKGAVVLFDECDELFRARNTGADHNDQTRGIAAFVTASMLPKLQDLRDRGQIVLFILTNHFDQMDPAIKRIGRIDFTVPVGPPDLARRRAYVDGKLDDLAKTNELIATLTSQKRKTLIDEVAKQTSRYVRGEVIDFVDQLPSRLRGQSVTKKAISDAVSEQADSIAPEQKAVTDELWSAFLKATGWGDSFEV